MSGAAASGSVDGGVWFQGVSRERLLAAVNAVTAGNPPDLVPAAAPPDDRGIRDQTLALIASLGIEDCGASRCPGHPAADRAGDSGGSDGHANTSSEQIGNQFCAARRLLCGIDADPALAGLARAATILATSLGASWLLGWLTAAGHTEVPDAAGAGTAAARAYEIAVATALVTLGLEPGTPDDTRAVLQATEALENYGSARGAGGGTPAANATVAALGRALCGDCRRWTPEEMALATVPGILGAARALVRAGHAARARAVFFVLAPTPPRRALFVDADVWDGRHRCEPS